MKLWFEMVPPYDLWTVYERLQPLQYVARLSLIGHDGVQHPEHTMVSSYLETIREELAARGLQPIPPHPHDDPQIVELWL
jgi:hypothetical protein